MTETPFSHPFDCRNRNVFHPLHASFFMKILHHPFACDFIALTGAALFIFSSATGYLSFRDGITMANVTKNIYTKHSIAIDEHLDQGEMIGRSSTRGTDGRLYSKYGIFQSILGLPLFACGFESIRLMHHVGLLANISPVNAGHFFFSTLNLFITLIMGIYLFFLVKHTTSDTLIPISILAVFTLATPAVTFAKTGFSQPLSALLVFISGTLILYAPPEKRQSFWLSGFFLGLAVLTRPVNIVITLPIAAFVITTRRIDKMLAWSIPLTLITLVQLLYNTARFSSPLSFGYTGETLSDPFVEGLVVLLFHPDIGILVYAPCIVLAIFFVRIISNYKPHTIMSICICAIFCVVYAKWWCKFGLAGWSGRFLYEIIPWGLFLMALTLSSMKHCHRIWLTGAVLFFGFLVNTPPMFANVRAAYERALTSPEGNMLFPYYVRQTAVSLNSDALIFREAGLALYFLIKILSLAMIAIGLYLAFRSSTSKSATLSFTETH